jgi:hypothetical protein
MTMAEPALKRAGATKAMAQAVSVAAGAGAAIRAAVENVV